MPSKKIIRSGKRNHKRSRYDLDQVMTMRPTAVATAANYWISPCLAWTDQKSWSKKLAVAPCCRSSPPIPIRLAVSPPWSIRLFPFRGTPLYLGGGERPKEAARRMRIGGEERHQGSTAGFLLQLFCSVQDRQGDIQGLCWRCHSGWAHCHELIQVVSGPLIVSFARTNYFLGWHRNWYRLWKKSGWVRSNFSCESLLDITQPDLDLRINGYLRYKTPLFVFKNIEFKH